ncbi:hypothetical protein [Francisella tularensis]|uniref:hypothetical protein n=1 Tax=Francisella tularensis TaxID=263 RepID=UPI0008F51996|nr:hypothetical protein [Francisella tularensis]APA83602.1 hypothetical protein N894_1618 [Francisella tularensis subsp. novicida PA10-7858]
MFVLFLIATSFLIPFFSYKKNVFNKNYFIVFCFFILLHQLFSILFTSNGLIFPSYDSGDFNHLASLGYPQMCEEPLYHLSICESFRFNDAYTFSYVYSFFYKLENSILTGNSLSIIGYVISIIMLTKMMNLLEVSSSRQLWVLILTSILPINISVESQVMRESWMLCFFVTMIYFIIKHYLVDRRARNIFFAFVLFLLLLILHFKSAIFYGSCIFMLYLYILFRCTIKFNAEAMAILFILLIVFFGVFYYCILQGFGDQQSIFSIINQWIKKVIGIQSLEKSTTNYTTTSDSNTNFLFFVLLQNIRYWFAPYPWEALNKGFLSLIFSIIGFLRFFMITSIVYSWRNYKLTLTRERREVHTFLFFCLFFVTFTFALGTGNYGTSVRHWDVSWWILCLLFVYTREKTIRVIL